MCTSSAPRTHGAASVVGHLPAAPQAASRRFSQLGPSRQLTVAVAALLAARHECIGEGRPQGGDADGTSCSLKGLQMSSQAFVVSMRWVARSMWMRSAVEPAHTGAGAVRRQQVGGIWTGSSRAGGLHALAQRPAAGLSRRPASGLPWQPGAARGFPLLSRHSSRAQRTSGGRWRRCEL